jgi:hypothetical protein
MRDADRNTQLKTPKREEAQLKTKEKIEEMKGKENGSMDIDCLRSVERQAGAPSGKQPGLASLLHACRTGVGVPACSTPPLAER